MNNTQIKKMIAQSTLACYQAARDGDAVLLQEIKQLYQDYDKLENQASILIQALYRDLEELQRRVKKLEEK